MLRRRRGSDKGARAPRAGALQSAFGKDLVDLFSHRFVGMRKHRIPGQGDARKPRQVLEEIAAFLASDPLRLRPRGPELMAARADVDANGVWEDGERSAAGHPSSLS